VPRLSTSLIIKSHAARCGGSPVCKLYEFAGSTFLKTVSYSNHRVADVFFKEASYIRRHSRQNISFHSEGDGLRTNTWVADLVFFSGTCAAGGWRFRVEAKYALTMAFGL